MMKKPLYLLLLAASVVTASATAAIAQDSSGSGVCTFTQKLQNWWESGGDYWGC